MNNILSILTLIGSLGLFLYGMKLMSESLQKVAGNRLRQILASMTKNRFMGVLTGLLITALIQSSSATTVMVVSFVNAGLLSLTQSISVIMGANIGTTVTAWIISLFGFKVNIATLAIPLIGISIPFIFSKKNQRKSFGEFLLGFALLFYGLELLKSSMPDLAAHPEILSFLNRYTDLGFASVLLFLMIGTILTIVVQSSSATMAITLIMCSKGWIPFELAAAMVLGENIGTTITANLAAIPANTSAKRTALAHLTFNVFGVIWMLLVFYPFTHGIVSIVTKLGAGDPTMLTEFSKTLSPETLQLISNSPASELNAEQQALQAQLLRYQVSTSYSLSLFHTAFNLINTFVMIWFVGFIAKVVSFVIKKKETDEEFHLKYITTSMLSTSELSLLQSEKEIHLYGQRTQRMFGFVKDLHLEKNENEFVKLFSRIEKYEQISDRTEVEIASYLNKVAEGRLSDEGKQELYKQLRIITEIESISDSCYNLARTISRQQEQKIDLPEMLKQNVQHMYELLNKAFAQMELVLSEEETDQAAIDKSTNIETEINNYRNALKNQNIIDLNNRKYEYEVGVIYMDIIGECEKMGDYIINVVESYK
jgi:phosphate:Na+ symporter